jgi:hypothetical protein
MEDPRKDVPLFLIGHLNAARGAEVRAPFGAEECGVGLLSAQSVFGLFAFSFVRSGASRHSLRPQRKVKSRSRHASESVPTIQFGSLFR